MWVGLSIHLENTDLSEALKRFYGPEDVWLVDDLPDSSWPFRIFDLRQNESEFPVVLTCWNCPRELEYEEGLRLASFLSIELPADTICDGSFHGDNDSPYWSIIWKNGSPFLADDCSSIFGDGEGGHVRIVRKIYINKHSSGSP